MKCHEETHEQEREKVGGGPWLERALFSKYPVILVSVSRSILLVTTNWATSGTNRISSPQCNGIFGGIHSFLGSSGSSREGEIVAGMGVGSEIKGREPLFFVAIVIPVGFG